MAVTNKSTHLSSIVSPAAANKSLEEGEKGGGRGRVALVETGWGVCGVRWRELGPAGTGPAFAGVPLDALLCRIVTPGLSRVQLRAHLRQQGSEVSEVLPDGQGRFHPGTVPTWFGELVGFLQGYFSREMRGGGLPRFVEMWTVWQPRLDFRGLTDFQREVLAVVGQIPRGQVLTYGQVARRVGRPGAARAVGGVMRANPWPVLIPCHRVVGSRGALTGFTAPGGVGAKRRMLEMEEVRVGALQHD